MVHPYAQESQFLWVGTLHAVEDLYRALEEWLVIYREQWLVERHGFRALARVHLVLLTEEVVRECTINPVLNNHGAAQEVHK